MSGKKKGSPYDAGNTSGRSDVRFVRNMSPYDLSLTMKRRLPRSSSG